MKARVKSTGEIVNVHRLCMSSQGDIWQKKSGKEYFEYELDFDVKEPPKPRYNPDYWTRLEHQAAIGAMQGLLANSAFDDVSVADIAITSVKLSTSLIERLKEERK